MVTMCGIYDIYGGHIQTLFYYSKGGGGEGWSYENYFLGESFGWILEISTHNCKFNNISALNLKHLQVSTCWKKCEKKGRWKVKIDRKIKGGCYKRGDQTPFQTMSSCPV